MSQGYLCFRTGVKSPRKSGNSRASCFFERANNRRAYSAFLLLMRSFDMSSNKKPMVLVILDGYGHREEQQDNAILNAKTPVMDNLWKTYPHTLIAASGLDVGLPDGQMGNSEVGHVNLGAGRIVYQDLTRLDKEIKEGDFFENAVLAAAVDRAVSAGKAVHIMGLLSAGGVHSHEDHIMAMVELAHRRGAKAIYLHAFLDGRDTPPRSAESALKRFTEKFAQIGTGRIASIIGRYYAMDRDNRWDRVQLAYDLMSQAKGAFIADDAVTALQAPMRAMKMTNSSSRPCCVKPVKRMRPLKMAT